MEKPNLQPGPVLLFGSGETHPSSGGAYEHLANVLKQKPEIAIFETPAGFELNSEKVAGNIRDFLSRRLQNYDPRVTLIPARNKKTQLSPDNSSILEPVLRSNWLLLGPGSPTYAVRQLDDSLAMEYIKAKHLLGGALILASAALLAFSQLTLPVYEIYKVGDELHWQNGLDYFSLFGLKLVFIPHWNNSDGGKGLDTSRCFMGQKRFDQLSMLLPEDITTIGIDEQTSLFFKFGSPCTGQVFGKGAVTILRKGKQQVITAGQTITFEEIEGFCLPDLDQVISSEIKDRILNSSFDHPHQEPGSEILDLVIHRQKARENQDWARADQLRDQLLSMGWKVKDTPNGPELEPLE